MENDNIQNLFSDGETEIIDSYSSSLTEVDGNSFSFDSLLENNGEEIEIEGKPTEDNNEEIVKDQEDNKEGSESEDEPVEDALKTIFEYLHEEGIVSLDDEVLKKEQLEDGDIVSIIDKEVQSRVSKQLATYEHPKVKEFIDFLQSGGTPNQFLELNQEVDLANITNEDIQNSEENQEIIITYLLEKRGFSADEIKEEIQMYKDTGILDTKALKSLEAAKKIQAEDKEVTKAKLIKEKQEKEQDLINKKNEVISQINSTTELMGIKFTDTFKKGFQEFIFGGEKSGVNNVAEELRKKENFLKVALLAYTKFDLSKLAQQTETQVKKTLRDKLNASGAAGNAVGSRQRQSTISDLTKISKLL